MLCIEDELKGIALGISLYIEAMSKRPCLEEASRKKKSKRGDIGRAQVKFVTSKATLTANSSYFAAQFSSLWDTSNDDDDEEVQEHFLDQDPGPPFEVLLSFMRKGCIEIDKLVSHR